ncbi:hypothetical protein [Halorussus sp. MSC15.2]|uniref:hypothetical protein n=1 Tax=Halorussus sp. MSC15.2 TaxID=2283638 RepID=UPI0013D81CBD|nr:hypothetical protein [Halorussus sp. MSC15.2]NEU56824.1 hypothetical protein [Halorussus sp. MSC15.2]
MPAVDADLVERLSHHDEYFTAKELVRFLERHHAVEGPGVPRDLVEAYAEELEYDLDRLRTSLDDRQTDARTWQSGERLYNIDGNVSIYPPSWHEQLAGTTDLPNYVEVMLESVRAPEGVEIDQSDLGVSQEALLTAVEIIGGIDRGSARELLRSQRLEGNLVLWAFQNPEELVRLPEETTD